MTERNQRRTALMAAAIALSSLTACGESPATMAEAPAPPPGIPDAENRRCHAEGRQAGAQAVADMSSGAETVAILTGGVGAIAMLAVAGERRDSAYSDGYRSCLERVRAADTPKLAPAAPPIATTARAEKRIPAPNRPEPRAAAPTTEAATDGKRTCVGVGYLSGLGSQNPWDPVPCE